MNGIESIAAERRRQIKEEGWAWSHDDMHTNGELALAAASYAYVSAQPECVRRIVSGIYSIDNFGPLREMWPFSKSWWKPTDRRRDLVKAGALIAAEIDRLDRLAARDGDPEPDSATHPDGHRGWQERNHKGKWRG